MDLSFNNQAIKKFFEEKDDSYIPTAELIYIHNHPMVSPNFVQQIDADLHLILAQVAEKLLPENSIAKLTASVIALGQLMPEVTDDNAENILKLLRDIFWHIHEIKEFLKGL